MGLYKSFIDILRRTTTQEPFTTTEVVAALEAAETLDSVTTDLSNADATIQEALKAHKNAKVIDHEDGSVITSKIADNAVTTAKMANNSVTENKIVDSAVTAAKIADYAIEPIHLSEQINNVLHTHANKTTLDSITSEKWGQVYTMHTDLQKTESRYMINLLTDYEDANYYHFPYEVGEFFEIYNNVDDDICSVPYNDDVSWDFSQPMMTDKWYLARITQIPVSTVDDRVNGKIEVIKEVAWESNSFEKFYNRICDLECDTTVTTEKIQDAAVTAEKIQDEAITMSHLSSEIAEAVKNKITVDELETAVERNTELVDELVAVCSLPSEYNGEVIEVSITGYTSNTVSDVTTMNLKCNPSISKSIDIFYDFTDDGGAVDALNENAGGVYSSCTIGGLIDLCNGTEVSGSTLESTLKKIVDESNLLYLNSNSEWEIVPKSLVNIQSVDVRVSNLEDAVFSVNATLEQLIAEGV